MASLESRSTGHTVALQALTSVIVRVPCPPDKALLCDSHLSTFCSSKRSQGAPAGCGAPSCGASGAANGAYTAAACAVLISSSNKCGAAAIASCGISNFLGILRVGPQ